MTDYWNLRIRSELNEAAELTNGVRLETYWGEADAAPWVLFGSGVLLLHGIREEVGDLDVFAAAAMWARLANHPAWVVRVPDAFDPPFLERRVDGLLVHVFYTWTARDQEVNALDCRRAAEEVRMWPCTPLRLIRAHKAGSIARQPDAPYQAKHYADVEAIDRVLAGRGVAA